MRVRLVVGAALLATCVPAAAQIDGSGTVTTGGQSQVVFQARDVRQYVSCQNPLSATETLYMNAPTAAGPTGSWELAPGGSQTFMAPSFVPYGAISVYAATTGHRFICKQG
jgi:hypothetical protein